MGAGRKIRISWAGGEVIADLGDSLNANQILASLPCNVSASTWGEEVYFALPVRARLESDARQVVEPGTVCFWVEGSALALPFGPTPVSRGDECRLVTPCNVVGRVEGDPRRLKEVRQGTAIRVELIEDR